MVYIFCRAKKLYSYLVWLWSCDHVNSVQIIMMFTGINVQQAIHGVDGSGWGKGCGCEAGAEAHGCVLGTGVRALGNSHPRTFHICRQQHNPA